MPSYNLAAPESQVVVTWLFELNGYLDFAVRVLDSQTAREALAADAALDVAQWVRDNPLTNPQGTETAMVWWIWKNDQVNVTPPARPPETTVWISILEGWDASIDAGFARASQQARNQNTVPLTGENGGVDGMMPAGAHLTHQQQLISKVLGVLV